MKKYLIAVLCVCTALTSYAIQLELKHFGRPAKRVAYRAWERRNPIPSSISVPRQPVSWRQTDFKGLPGNLHEEMAKEILDRTRATRFILNEEGSLSWDTDIHINHPNGQGLNIPRENVFAQGMNLVDQLTHEMNLRGYEPSFIENPVDLTEYFKLSAKTARLIERWDYLDSLGRNSTQKEKDDLIEKQNKLLQRMKNDLETKTGIEDLSIRDFYAPNNAYLIKFDGIAHRLAAQGTRMQEESPSPLFTLSPQDRINYARARTLQIIEFQEQLRDFIRDQMDQPWTSNMARLDFVLCVYKYYYSTLAGHPIPVLSYYYEKGLESNFEAGGLIQQIKPGWADKERALFQEQPAPFSRIPGYVSPVNIYPTEKTAAPQTTQVVDLPRANPSFEGLSSDQFATIAKNAIEKTKGYIETISLDDHNVYEGFREEYTQIYQDSLSLIEQMAQEVKSLIWQRSTLSPTKAEVQLAKILETQTALRTFTAKVLTSKNADTMIHLDYILSHYGYLYATSAGIFATVPTELSYPYFSDHINDTLDRWRTRLRNKNPMVSKKEVNPRRSSEQPKEGPKQSSEEFVALAQDILKKTKGPIDYSLSLDDYNVYTNAREDYRNILQDGQLLLGQMVEEIESLVAQGTALSPAKAEVQLGKILETQTTLRIFAARHVPPRRARMIVKLDYLLSQYRYLYATAAGISAIVPEDYSNSLNEIANTVNKWDDWYQHKNPMIPRTELAPKQPNI